MTAELVFSVAGIYACFLTWGILQERVTTTPYYGHAVIDDGTSQQPAAYFRHFVFLNAVYVGK